MADVLFHVVGRSKSEKVTKEGQLVITYKVTLKTEGDKCKLVLTDTSPSLLSQYPLTGEVAVRIGVCDQTTLDKNINKALEAAEEAGKEE